MKKSNIFAMVIYHAGKFIAGNYGRVVIHTAVCIKGNFFGEAAVELPLGFTARIGMAGKKDLSAALDYIPRSIFALIGGKLRVGDKICSVQPGIYRLVYERFNFCRSGFGYPIVVLFLRGKKIAQL